MLATILTAAGLWFGVIWAYIAVMHAKAVNERGGLSLFWKVHVLPLAAIGLALDAVFNITFGSVMFRELPHELLFSSRVQRWVRIANGIHPDEMNARSRYRAMLAFFWARQLNAFDSDHIKL